MIEAKPRKVKVEIMNDVTVAKINHLQEHVMVMNQKNELKAEPHLVTPVGAGLTQAEYERVVKGVKLSDPVDAGVSTQSGYGIYSICRSSDASKRWIIGTLKQTEYVDTQNETHVLNEYEKSVHTVISVGEYTVVCVYNNSVRVYRLNALVYTTKQKFSDRQCNAIGELEDDTHRSCVSVGRFVCFQRAEGYNKRGRIVQVNLDTFEERVLDKLKENIADFLVDENQTITYLTSAGELIQENVDNNTSIPRTCVNLKTDTTTGGEHSALCRLSNTHFVACHYKSTEVKRNKKTVYKFTNTLILSTKDKVISALAIESESENKGTLSVTKTYPSPSFR